MPRQSKKLLALDAARDIVAEEGIAAVTYDSLAERSGLSKSGLIYHFPSRHSLLVELHRYAAQMWEDELLSLAGDDLSLEGRRRALMLSTAKTDPVVELLLSIHSTSHPDFAAPWEEVERRWKSFITFDDQGLPATKTDEEWLLSLIICTGLWVFDHITTNPLPAASRDLLTDKALNLLRQAN